MNTTEVLPSPSTPLSTNPDNSVDVIFEYTALIGILLVVFMVILIPLLMVLFMGKSCLIRAALRNEDHKILSESSIEESIAAKSRTGLAIPNPYILNANPYYSTLEHRLGDPNAHAPSLASYLQRQIPPQCLADTASVIKEEEKEEENEINDDPEVLSVKNNNGPRKPSLEISDI